MSNFLTAKMLKRSKKSISPGLISYACTSKSRVIHSQGLDITFDIISAGSGEFRITELQITNNSTLHVSWSGFSEQDSSLAIEAGISTMKWELPLMSKYRVHSPEFKDRVAMEALNDLKMFQDIAADHMIHPIQVSQ